MKMIVKEPLLRLANFNAHGKELLKAVTTLNNKKDIEDKLLHIIRRTVIAERFFDKRLIAITGLQGQGKSSLIRALFNLPDGYIPTNIGRGEQEPIIIKWEDTIKDIECYKYGYNNGEICEVAINKEELKHIAENGTQDKDAFYLEIRVPAKKDNPIKDKEFLLLPGIESKNKISDWQKNITYNLEWCLGAVVVTQLEKLADKSSKEFKSILEDKLGNNYTLVVSFCDGKNENELRETKKRASEAFFGNEATDNVVCTGMGSNNSFETGKAEFELAIQKINIAPKEWKAKNTDTLKNIIDDNLGDLLADIKDAKISMNIEKNYVSNQEKEEALKSFDKGVKELKKAFDLELEKALAEYDKHIRPKLDQLREEEGIFKAFWKGIFGSDHKALVEEISKRYKESEEKLKELVSIAISDSSKSAVEKIQVNKKNYHGEDNFLQDIMKLSNDNFPNGFKFVPMICFYYLANPYCYSANVTVKQSEENNNQKELFVDYFNKIFSGLKNKESSKVVEMGGNLIMNKIKNVIPALKLLDLAEKIVSSIYSYFKYIEKRDSFMDELLIRNKLGIKEYYDNFFSEAMINFREAIDEEIDKLYGVADTVAGMHNLNIAIANMERIRVQFKKEIIEWLI